MRASLLALLASLAVAVGAANFERVIYRGEPLPVRLVVGEEYELRVDDSEPLDVGFEQQHVEQLNVQSVPGRIFLTARQAFGPARVFVRTSKRLLILNVSAQADGAPSPGYLVTWEGDAPPAAAESPETGACDRFTYVAAARWAMRQLYSPERLAPPTPCLSAVAFSAAERWDWIDCGRSPACAGGIVAEPIGSWQGGEWFVHAFRVQNKLRQPVELDPRLLRGELLAASFAHGWLGAAGEPTDTTSLILITRAALEDL